MFATSKKKKVLKIGGFFFRGRGKLIVLLALNTSALSGFKNGAGN